MTSMMRRYRPSRRHTLLLAGALLTLVLHEIALRALDAIGVMDVLLAAVDATALLTMVLAISFVLLRLALLFVVPGIVLAVGIDWLVSLRKPGA